MAIMHFFYSSGVNIRSSQLIDNNLAWNDQVQNEERRKRLLLGTVKCMGSSFSLKFRFYAFRVAPTSQYNCPSWNTFFLVVTNVLLWCPYGE